MMKRIILLVSAVVVIVSPLFFTKPIRAVDASELNVVTNCQSKSKGSFTGALRVPAGSYEVYVKLAKRGQLASIQTYGQLSGGASDCQLLQTTDASGDYWTKAGTWKQETTEAFTIFQISSDQLGTSIDANRPSVMLVSSENPVCVPNVQCGVKVGSEEGYILPSGTLTTEDSVHIVRVVDPATDIITKVVYYVDDEPVYSTKTLQDFDLRYVTYGNQKLTRVAEYESGQRVVLEALPPDTFHDNFFNFLFRITQSNPIVFWISLSVVSLVVIGSVILAIIRRIRRRHDWRLAHGLIHQQAQAVDPNFDYEKAEKQSHLIKIVERGIVIGGGVVGIAIVAVLVNTFIITLFKVDGPSMQSTFLSGNTVLISKIPVTWAHTRSVQFTPSRGDVVIVKPVYGIVDPVVLARQETAYIVKRVIGLPGERVVVKDGKVTVFNTQHPGGFVPDEGSSWEKTMHNNDTAESVDVTLGSDELFISGDNRPVSIDSRFNGPISTRQLIGIVLTKL